MKKFKNKSGFTLMEVLIYTSLFAIVGSLLVGILLTITQVQQRESAAAEVTGQLNFVMQTINRLVRESSNIEIETGTTVSTLKLRMQNTAKDPTCISLVSGVIKLAEGSGGNPNYCTANTADLTNDRVTVNTFNFKKFVQYPGHDTVSIDITMTYNTQNPKSQIQRTLSSAIARVSAATFDSDLLPGSDSSYDVGYSPTTRWRNGAFSGDLLVSGNVGIGTTGPGYTLTVNGTAWVTSGNWSGSDIRWKKDIIPLENSLTKIIQLQGVGYDWRVNEFPELKFQTGRQIGLIAQQVEGIIPEIVSTDQNGYKGISYEKLTPVLVEAIKELKLENDALKKRIEILETK